MNEIQAALDRKRNGETNSEFIDRQLADGFEENYVRRGVEWQLKSAWAVIDSPAAMREVIIEGVLRRGEVVNIIASTKIGKSWLALLLAFCVACGRSWLGRKTTKGRVLYLDNELHDETLQNRMSAVARKGRFKKEDADFDYVDLRGQAVGIGDLKTQLSRFKPGELTLVILDAKYRFFGSGSSENSNDDQTEFHNAVDNLARELDCAIVLIHHTTKGEQGAKEVTDIGAGGGSQSRTVDCHMVIRPHAESDDLSVLQYKVRSFPPDPDRDSQTIRWEYPLWYAEDDIEPELKQNQSPNAKRSEAATKERLTAIVQMLRKEPGNIASENKLSGNKPHQVCFQAAINILKEEGTIEWVPDYRPPRTPKEAPPTGGWRLPGEVK